MKPPPEMGKIKQSAMSPEILSPPLITNKLYEQNFFEKTWPSLLPEIPGHKETFEACRKLFQNHPDLDKYHENQIEDAIIKPILAAMGWALLPQEVKIISGLQQKIDIILFSADEVLKQHQALEKDKRYANFEGISVLVESKAANKLLDNKKAAKDNPYFQLLHYLQSSKIDYGFLTNGREWRFLDNSQIAAEKRYLAFQLDQILSQGDTQAFNLFWRAFHPLNFAAKEEKPAPVIIQSHQDRERRITIEDDLKTLIYGEDGQDSIFEDIGRALFEASGDDPSPENLALVFKNSLYLLFRLIFIAFFESRHRGFLSAHQGYPGVALWKIYDDLAANPQETSAGHTGWSQIKKLFEILDKGDQDLAVPLLNGGLFNPEQASLLTKVKVFTNNGLYLVLHRLLRDRENNHRDFSALSVVHLGTIYEGLLEFEFRVAEEALKYLRAYTPNGQVEGYFDAYDQAGLGRATPKGRPKPEELRDLAKGSFYLVSAQNNRKAGGSYYTPESLARPLAERAIDQQLAGPFKSRSLLEMRILDSACGSGHLLLEALNVLTRRAQERLPYEEESPDGDRRAVPGDEPLKAILSEEMDKISKNLRSLGLTPEQAGLDEFAVLKRILLKKVIFGVDVSPFAVELAQLALWIDTFIFGTPLSFIEHHLKCGNSLIGTDMEKAEDRLVASNSLFNQNLRQQISGLKKELGSLSALNDSTQADIEASKRTFENQIIPQLAALNWYLDVVNHLDILALDRHRPGPLPTLERLAVPRDEVKAPGYPQAVDTLKEKYRFFNWEVEFPEAFNGQSSDIAGFNIIIGNPPWDKTKFDDPLFFAQYRSNYRSLSNSAKKTLATDLLAKPYIRGKYEREKQKIQLANEYYKNHYPLNVGVGDGNLFRFFVERNLSLLASGGSLNYVLPTGLLTEDGSSTLRKHFLTNFRLNYFEGFENRVGLFPDVHKCYKFGLIQIEKTKDVRQKSRCRFLLTDPEALKTSEGVFNYSLKDLKTTSPEHWAYMEAGGGQRDILLLKRMYAAFSPLNPAWLDFRYELHATNDKALFREKKTKGDLPLYKGASIWQYHSAYTEPEYWLNSKEFDGYLEETEINRLVADVYPFISNGNSKKAKLKVVLDKLGLTDKKQLARFIRPDRHYLRLSFRDIARDTDERTLITALIPCHVGAQNTLGVSIPKTYRLSSDFKAVQVIETPLPRLLFAQAIFNSLPIDWILRFSVSIHVNKTYLTRLPLPQPTDGELASNSTYKAIIRQSAALSLYNAPDLMTEIKTGLKIKDSEIPTTQKQFDETKIGLDLAVAKLYQLGAKDIEHMLTSFKVLARKHPEYVARLLERAKEEL